MSPIEAGKVFSRRVLFIEFIITVYFCPEIYHREKDFFYYFSRFSVGHHVKNYQFFLSPERAAMLGIAQKSVQTATRTTKMKTMNRQLNGV